MFLIFLKVPVMRPRAAEGVPVLDVKTPDRSWIVGEETVVDDLVKMGMF